MRRHQFLYSELKTSDYYWTYEIILLLIVSMNRMYLSYHIFSEYTHHEDLQEDRKKE